MSNRRRPQGRPCVIRVVLSAVAVSAFTLSLIAQKPAALAENWPSKLVMLIMGFPAGVDVMARIIQELLSRQFGQTVIIDYKSGAAGNIASDYVSHAKRNGYTLAFGTAATHRSNAALYSKLPFDVEADFVLVAPVLDVSNVLTVNPDDMNVKTLKEFVALVKANSGKYNYASTGHGVGAHMAFAEFNSRLGLDMIHVPYKGGPEAITSVFRGETCWIMNHVQTVMSQYKAGKVRLLGVTTVEPVTVIKEVPIIAASGLPGTTGFDSSIWFGVFVPKGTDAHIVDKLNAAIKAVLEQPELRARFESQGNSVCIEIPAQFKQTVHDNRVKWAKVVKAANIRID